MVRIRVSSFTRWRSNQLNRPIAQLVRVPARKAGETGSNPDPGENFSLKLTTEDLPERYSEKLNSQKLFH